VADRLLVEVFSDLVCPWCYVGKRRLEHALERFPESGRVDVVWRSFELEPDAPATAEPRAEALARRYGMTADEAAQRDAHMSTLTAEAGLEYRPDLVVVGRTFDAHRVLHAAAAAGLQAQVKERLLRAHFAEGRPLTDHDTLVELAGEAGLDRDGTRAALADGAYAGAVRADEREAAQLGITGVPFFVLGRRYAVAGAQPPELLLQALERAFAETVTEPGPATA
jgi:predicted DsbA family dithiol-disulfide isomerase